MNIIIPRMGESITEVQIGQIFKSTGSQVKTDDEILELETEKVNQVLNAPGSGTVKLTVKQGDKVKVGDTIGVIEGNGGSVKEEPAAPKEAPKEPVKAQEPQKKEEAAPPQKPEDKKQESPPPQKPVEQKQESAEGARVFKEDFLESKKVEPTHAEQRSESVFVPNKPDLSKPQTRRKMTMIRQTIARRLVEAQLQTAMLTTFNEIDMSAVIAIREHHKEDFIKKYGVKLGFLSFFAKAIVSALHAYPIVNATIEGDEIVENHQVDLGIAVSTDRGLVVPVIRDVEHLSFSEIEKGIEGYAKKAREGGISVDDLRGGTFTLTNGGTFGSLLSTPILNFPQSGILGLHKIDKRAVVIDDKIEIRPMMYVALTYDHRIVDGREAVKFLVHVKELIEDPSRFVIDV